MLRTKHIRRQLGTQLDIWIASWTILVGSWIYEWAVGYMDRQLACFP